MHVVNNTMWQCLYSPYQVLTLWVNTGRPTQQSCSTTALILLTGLRLPNTFPSLSSVIIIDGIDDWNCLIIMSHYFTEWISECMCRVGDGHCRINGVFYLGDNWQQSDLCQMLLKWGTNRCWSFPSSIFEPQPTENGSKSFNLKPFKGKTRSTTDILWHLFLYM